MRMNFSKSNTYKIWIAGDYQDALRAIREFCDWPHRLGACGNAVVPQIPEMIGRAILQAEGV